MPKPKRITIQKDGPYRVEAGVLLRKELAVADENNDPKEWKAGEKYEMRGDYLLCRCGKSKRKPFCDWSHEDIGFDGTETAEHDKYRTGIEVVEGPEIDLLDKVPLCSVGRFCYRRGGTWKLTKITDNPEAREMVIQQACDCPSGKLVAVDKKTGEWIEKEFEPMVSVTEDISAGVSGPLVAKGGIEVVGADGEPYEVRNRQALCRCGRSFNKPFCDGTHIGVGFDDKK